MQIVDTVRRVMKAGRSRLRQLGWEPYAWLVYSLPFLYTSAMAPMPTGRRIWLLSLFVVFLVLYIGGHFVRSPRILWIVAGLDLIAIFGSVHNPSAAAFFIYGSALIAYGFPQRQAMMVLAAQVLISTVASSMLGMEWWYYMASVVISALIGAVTIQAAAKAAGDAKLRLAQDEIERIAKLAERERIARDLHDLLGHTLSVVVLKSELARKLMTRDPSRALQEIAEVERISRQGLAEVREAITGYRTTGLAAEIDHVRDTLTAAGINATIEARPIALAPAQETALSLALREAATNVIRHSAATRCHIKFYAQDGSALMEVQDDGRGGEAPFGNGLSGMRERIQALGGALLKDGAQGTRLRISLPLDLPTV
jgi:two-component system sensor histidine kinase DesK